MSVQSLDRAFDILEILASERHGMNLTDIARKVDLHKSTVHRLLGSLKDRGYVEQIESDGSYRLGLGLLALTSRHINNLEIQTEAQPYMRRLSDKLGQTVFLAIIRDGEAVYMDKVERFDGLRRYSIIGRRIPVHCSSLGKSLVMDLSPAELRETIGPGPFQALTPQTITDIGELERRLAIYRKRGWSEDIEENEEGVSCVGAPIRDYRGMVIAAISSAWEGKKSRRDIDRVGAMIKDSADDISRHLGYFSVS